MAAAHQAQSEDVIEWGQAPRDTPVIAVFTRLTRSQSPFFHNLSVAALLLATVLGGSGCLPRGPISIPWESLFPPCEGCQHGTEASPGMQFCESQNGNSQVSASQSCGSRTAWFDWRLHGPASPNDGYVMPPHSMFHPVPTRPVFTPWIVDQPPEMTSERASGAPAELPPPEHSTAAGQLAPQVPPEPPVIGTPAQAVSKRTAPAPVNLDPDDKAKAPAGGSGAAGPARAATGGGSVGGTAGGWRGTDLD